MDFPSTPRSDSIFEGDDSHGGGIEWARHSRSHDRTTRRRTFELLPARATTVPKCVGFWRLRWFWRAVRVARRRSRTAWIGKLCATGCIATTPPGSRALRSRCSPGQAPMLTREQKAELKALVI